MLDLTDFTCALSFKSYESYEMKMCLCSTLKVGAQIIVLYFFSAISFERKGLGKVGIIDILASVQPYRDYEYRMRVLRPPICPLCPDKVLNRTVLYFNRSVRNR